jgi:hypothetical protein
MKKILVFIFILSVADVALTYLGIKAGYIEEANPLLQKVFHTSPELTVLLILAVVGVMLYVIGKYGYKVKHINVGLVAMVAVKMYVMYAHFQWIRQVI